MQQPCRAIEAIEASGAGDACVGLYVDVQQVSAVTQRVESVLPKASSCAGAGASPGPTSSSATLCSSLPVNALDVPASAGASEAVAAGNGPSADSVRASSAPSRGREAGSFDNIRSRGRKAPGAIRSSARRCGAPRRKAP